MGRMTRKRALALYDAAGRGLDEWEDEYDADPTPERLNDMEAARAAMTVLYGRYIQQREDAPTVGRDETGAGR